MIEYENKEYYTPFELIDFINDESSEFSRVWRKHYPKWKEVVLLTQINRVLREAKKEKKLNYIRFKKNPDAEKTFYGYAIEDVIDYLEKKNPKVFNIESIKEEGEKAL